MLSKKSVSEIFQTMDTADSDKVTDNVEVKEWLANYKKTEMHTEAVIDKNFNFNPSTWKLKIEEVISTLEKNWEFLSQVLNETLYCLADSKEIVTVFRKDLKFFFGIVDDDFFYAKGQEFVDLHVSEKDLYILGRLIAPLLIAGYAISIHPIEISILPYLAAIGYVISKAGVPIGTKYIPKFNVQITNDPARFVISAEITTHYCPMIIFDDADLYSALDCLIDSCHRFNGMLYWTVTHAYIQESVFDNFVSKLKVVSQRKPQITLIGCNQKDKLKDDVVNEIFKFFVGWDPRDLELNSNLRMAVSLLPFRTSDEVISLINSQNTACTASLWTEKISIANRVSKSLKIGTIWINSHGNIDAMIPLESFSESHLPLNGVQLLEYISTLSKFNSIENNKSSIISTNPLPGLKLKGHFSKSVEEAVNFCQQGNEILRRFDDKTVHKLLANLVCCGMVQHDNSFSSFSGLNSDAVYHPSPKMDVFCYSCTHEAVMVMFPSEAVSLNIFFKIFYHLIQTRNAVIICAPKDVLDFISLFSPPQLFLEMITLLDLKNYNKCNEHTKRIGKILVFDLKNFAEFSKDLDTNNHLNSIFKGKKSVWMPTY